jgi:hypothetical protein
MATTIQISEGLQSALSKKKLYDRETYEEVIWALIEDTLEISEETKQELAVSRQEAKAGKTVSFEDVKKKAGI